MSGQTSVSADERRLEQINTYGSERPTEGQLIAARELGINFPDDVSRDELRDLISLNKLRDKLASAHLHAIAAQYGVKTTRYSGKKLLFQRIFDRLSQPGHEHDLASWFAYRVYRELVGGAADSAVTGPSDPLIQMVARYLAADSAVIVSIRRYRGSDLIWFGRWTAPDGTTHEGGSNRTTAYKRAAELLRPFATGERRETLARDSKRRAAPPSAESIRTWLARVEQAMRDQNSMSVKITRWHVVAWVVIAVLFGLLIFGP